MRTLSDRWYIQKNLTVTVTRAQIDAAQYIILIYLIEELLLQNLRMAKKECGEDKDCASENI